MVEQTAGRKLISLINSAGVKHWQLAEAIGVSEGTLTRWLRHEPEGERRERILAALEKMRQEVHKNG